MARLLRCPEELGSHGSRDTSQFLEAGFGERQANALAQAIRGEARPSSDVAGLNWPVGICFAALIAAVGRLLIQFHSVREEVLTETRLDQQRIEANRDRIDGVAGQIVHANERLARIETMLEERLPPRS